MREGYRGVWWLSPAGAAALVVLPTLLIADRVSDSAFRDDWRTPKALDHAHVRLFLAGALLFLAGAMWPLLNRARDRRETWVPTTPDQRRWLVKATNVAFWLTITGYVAFAVSGYRHGVRLPDLQHALFHQDVDGLKEDFASILGITTLTQAGIAFVILATFLLTQGPVPRLRKRLVIVFVLSLARAFFLTERLAIIEVVVPAVFVWIMARTPARTPGRQTILRLAPLVVLPAVMFLFGRSSTPAATSTSRSTPTSRSRSPATRSTASRATTPPPTTTAPC